MKRISLILCALSAFLSCGNIDSIMGAYSLSTVDVADVADGRHEGEYRNVGYARVAVDVASGRIEKIEIIEHESSFVGRRAEAITERVVHAQSTAVDAVSGATISSRVILKAIDTALVKGTQL